MCPEGTEGMHPLGRRRAVTCPSSKGTIMRSTTSAPESSEVALNHQHPSDLNTLFAASQGEGGLPISVLGGGGCPLARPHLPQNGLN